MPPTFKDDLRRAVLYGLPVFGTTLLIVPGLTVLAGIYAKDYALGMTAVGAVIFIGRLFDAITDPLVGLAVDRSRGHGVGYKVWIVAGGVSMPICGYFLYAPAQAPTIGYFAFWSLALVLAWTCFVVPHWAWGSGLTREPQARMQLFTIRSFFAQLASVAFFATPYLPVFDTPEVTAATLEYVLVLSSLALLPGLYVAVRHVPESDRVAGTKNETLPMMLESVPQNKPLCLYLLFYAALGTGGGMFVGLQFVVVSGYYGLADRYALILLLSMAASVISIPLWRGLIRHFDKQAVWVWAVLIYAASLSAPLFIAPGTSALLPLMLMSIGVYVGNTCGAMVSPAVLADIVDYGTLKSGAERAGSCFALFNLALKTMVGFGAAFGFMLAGWMDVDPSAAANTQRGRWAVLLCYSVLPMVLLLIAAYIAYRLPLNAHRMRIIQRRLDSRRRRMRLAEAGVPSEYVRSAARSIPASGPRSQ